MTSLLSQTEFKTVSQKRARANACAIDLHAFSLMSQAAQNADQLCVLMMRTLRAAGVEFLQLATYRRLQFASVTWSFLPDALVDADSAPRVCDSIACRAMASGHPEAWDCELSSDAAEWRNALLENGIVSGVTTAIHGANDWRYIYHYGSADVSCFDVGSTGLGVFSTLGFIATQRLMSLQPQTAVTSADAPLSARELEVIRWCKDGKSYPEIARILGISTKTVEFHISNAMRKLGVNQKISAIVETARLGLIDL